MSAHEKRCELCGRTFVARRSDARFHSATCRQTARRHPERVSRSLGTSPFWQAVRELDARAVRSA